MDPRGSFVVKVKYENTLRRITMSKVDELSFGSLKVKIVEMFKVPEGQSLIVTYTDEEGDVVTMGDDADFHDAVLLQKLNPLRITVMLGTSAAAVEPAVVAASEVEAVPAAAVAAPAVQPEVVSAEPADGAKKAEIRKLHKEIHEKLCAALGGAGDNASATFAQFEPLLRTAPAKLAEVINAARKAGLQASFEPSFTPGPSPAPAPTVKAIEPAAASPAASQASPVAAEFGTEEALREASRLERVCHRGVQCDGCGMSPIVGPRYKSTVKDDFDLCRSCYATQGVDGEYNKIEKPVFRQGMHPFWGHARPAGMHGMHGMHAMHGPRGFGPAGAHGPFGPGPSFGGRPFHLGRGGGCHRPMGGCRMQDGHHLDSRFVKDVSILDGTEVPPNTHFTKIWRLRNSGGRPWPEQTQLVHVGGDQLGSGEPVTLQLPEAGVGPGEEVEVSVDLMAPKQPGRYVSHWRLLAPGGPKFGHRVWALIQVVPTGEPSQLVPQADKIASAENAIVKEAQVEQTPSPPPAPAPAPQEPAASDVTCVLYAPVTGSSLYPQVVGVSSKDTHPAASDDVAAGYVSAAGDLAFTNEAMITPTAPAAPDSPEAEATSFGGFAFVEHPGGDVSVAEKVAEQAPMASAPASQRAPSTDMVKEELTSEEFIMAPESEVDELERLTAELQSMGFPDAQLNKQVLEAHNLDVQKALDELVAAGDWDEMLEELEEMGFNDKNVNRRLMFKNKGSVKHVVKELVQMYKVNSHHKVAGVSA